MKTYTVSGRVTVSCWTTVTAEDEAQAVRIAAMRDIADVHIDGSFEEEEYFHIDTDGTPVDLRVEPDA